MRYCHERAAEVGVEVKELLSSVGGLIPWTWKGAWSQRMREGGRGSQGPQETWGRSRKVSPPRWHGGRDAMIKLRSFSFKWRAFMWGQEVLIERQRWEARGRQHVYSFGTCLALQFRGRQGMNSDLPGGPNFFTRLWETNDYCVVMLKKNGAKIIYKTYFIL